MSLYAVICGTLNAALKMMQRDDEERPGRKKKNPSSERASDSTGGSASIFEEVISFLYFLQQQHKQGGFHQQHLHPHPRPGFRIRAPLDPTAEKSSAIPNGFQSSCINRHKRLLAPRFFFSTVFLVWFQSHFLLPIDPFVQTDGLCRQTDSLCRQTDRP